MEGVVHLDDAQHSIECIKQGSVSDANLVVVESFGTLCLLRSVWSAFRVQGGLNLVVLADAKGEHLFDTRIRLTRNKGTARIEDVGLFMLGDGIVLGFRPRKLSHVASQSRITKICRITISVPPQYRRLLEKSQHRAG